MGTFFLLQLNPTYMKRILHFKNITFKSSYNCFKIDIHQQLRPLTADYLAMFKLLYTTIYMYIRRSVRSDAQLSSTETRFQKCSQRGKNGSKHPMLSISMAFNVISCKKVERNTQKLKSADFTM